MMLNGKYNENSNYYTANFFGRDGLGHGDENWSEKDCGRKIGDWDGGFFLEHCHAKDCFFGCGGGHSSHSAMLDMMSLTAGIGFMMMDKMNLEMSKVQMCSKDNLSSNLLDLQSLLPGTTPIHLS